MLNLKPLSLNRRGFTLIELILCITITSILVIMFYSILEFNLKINERSLLEDEILLNGRYTLEYIKEEINRADKIVVSSKFKDLDKNYPTNIGFVIVNVLNYSKVKVEDEENGRAELLYQENEFSYTCYYFKKETLIRINAKAPSNVLPSSSVFKGYNSLGECLLEKSKVTLEEDDLINISLSLGKDNKEIANFKSTVCLRSPVVR